MESVNTTIDTELTFYEEFIIGDGVTNYVLSGLGDDILLNEEKLLSMIKSSSVQFNRINHTYEFVNIILNQIPCTISYL